jgi:hypothetical protein
MFTRLKLLAVFLAIAVALSACSGGQSAAPTHLNAGTPPAAATDSPATTQEPATANASPEATRTQIGSLDTAALMLDFSDASNEFTLRLVDTLNGASVPGYEPLSFSSVGIYTYLPGQQSLALMVHPDPLAPEHAELVVLDIPAWTTTSVPLPLDGWSQAMAVSRDGSRIGVVGYGDGKNLAIVDVVKGVSVAAASVPNLVRAMSFTQDGSGLMVYASNEDTKQGLSQGPPQAMLLDAADLSIQWRTGLPAISDAFVAGPNYQGESHSPGAGTRYLPGLAFSPVSDTLYVVHADEDRLTSVDFSSRKVAALDIRPPLSFIERLLSLGARVAHAKMQSGTEKHVAVSPDGSTLYVSGIDNQFAPRDDSGWDLNQQALGLKVVDAATGSELVNLDTQTEQVAMLPDGLVLLRTWTSEIPFTEVYDPAAKKIAAHYAGMYQNCVPLMKGGYVLAPSIDYGKKKHDMRVFEPASGKVLGAWEIDSWNTQWVACSP